MYFMLKMAIFFSVTICVKKGNGPTYPSLFKYDYSLRQHSLSQRRLYSSIWLSVSKTTVLLWCFKFFDSFWIKNYDHAGPKRVHERIFLKKYCRLCGVHSTRNFPLKMVIFTVMKTGKPRKFFRCMPGIPTVDIYYIYVP